MAEAPPRGLALWWVAIRPRTLVLGMVPVLVGTSCAIGAGMPLNGWAALAALAGAVLIQIGTNLFNDAGDFERGADRPDTPGRARPVALGWISATTARRAALLAFGLAGLPGLYLAWVGGWPILALGAVSVLAGLAYTGGPRPIAYSSWGELTVVAFFGIAAVVGSAWVQGRSMPPSAWLLGLALGLLAAAVLTVNNTRDQDSDRLVSKRTLAVRWGRPAMNRLYAVQMLAPFGLGLGLGSWPPLLAAPLALLLVRRFHAARDIESFERILGATAGLQVLFGVLAAAGLLFFPISP